jgi:hypothetical protein
MQWLGTSKYKILLISLNFQKLYNLTNVSQIFFNKTFIQVFDIIFKSWMGLVNLKGDVPNGTT